MSEAVELRVNNMASRHVTDRDCYSNKCANISFIYMSEYLTERH